MLAPRRDGVSGVGLVQANGDYEKKWKVHPRVVDRLRDRLQGQVCYPIRAAPGIPPSQFQALPDDPQQELPGQLPLLAHVPVLNWIV